MVIFEVRRNRRYCGIALVLKAADTRGCGGCGEGGENTARDFRGEPQADGHGRAV